MDPITVGTVIAGAKAGLDVIKQAADTVTAIRSAAKGPEGHKVADVDVGQLAELADNLIVARVRTLDTLNLAEQLQNENRELRQLVAKKDRFAEWSTRYQLRRFEDGAVLYEYVPQSHDTTPVHMICPSCFEEERISPLQPDVVEFGTTRMKCGKCGAVVPIPNNHEFQQGGRVDSDYNPFP